MDFLVKIQKKGIQGDHPSEYFKNHFDRIKNKWISKKPYAEKKAFPKIDVLIRNSLNNNGKNPVRRKEENQIIRINKYVGALDTKTWLGEFKELF